MRVSGIHQYFVSHLNDLFWSSQCDLLIRIRTSTRWAIEGKTSPMMHAHISNEARPIVFYFCHYFLILGMTAFDNNILPFDFLYRQHVTILFHVYCLRCRKCFMFFLTQIIVLLNTAIAVWIWFILSWIRFIN